MSSRPQGEPLPRHSVDKLLRDVRDLHESESETPGRYRIVREVGRGGMGIVYEAHDLELDRRVALKVIALPPGAGAEMRQRFLREARAAARLSHPGIAAVYDASDEAIAMQFVDGVTLAQHPRDDRRQLVRFVRDAALAVQAAHAQGVVHRDIKPHNLMVEDGRVLVTDFGLAKDLGLDAERSASGHVLGTPAYMSPEQAAGSDVDARTDVYGLGATLYELLANRPPFVAPDTARLLRAVIEDEPRPIRHFVSDVPRDLELVVLKCLSKERARRYASARELAEDLTRWLDGAPVRARQASAWYRISKLVRRHPASLGAGAAVLLAFATFAFAAYRDALQRAASTAALALSQRVDAVRADADMHRRLGEDELAAQRLDAGIAACRVFLARHDVAQAHFLCGRLLRERQDETGARAELDRALALDPSLVAARLERGLSLAAGVVSAAPASSAVPSEDAGARAARADLEFVLADASALRTVDVLFARAEVARLRGDVASARRDLTEVLRLDPVHVEARRARTQIALAEGDGDTAWHLAMSAVDIYRGFGPAYLARSASAAAPSAGDPLDRAVRQHALAAADLRVSGDPSSAEALEQRADARLSIDGLDGALADLGVALQATPTDALAFAYRAQVHARKAARAEASDDALAALGDACADYASALVLDPRLAGAHNNAGVCHLERARILRELGRGAEAEDESARAVRAFDRAIELAPRFGLALENRALSMRRAADRALRARDWTGARAAIVAAKADLDRALSLAPGSARWHADRALARALEGRLLDASGDAALADLAYQAAAADFDGAVEREPNDARARGLRGIFRLHRGDASAARADLEAALALAPDRKLSDELARALAQTSPR
ncbi:MAG: protein kinase domain-containing protein [Planctomycetota bacterium]